jgi:hypothetical protein
MRENGCLLALGHSVIQVLDLFGSCCLYFGASASAG